MSGSKKSGVVGSGGSTVKPDSSQKAPRPSTRYGPVPSKEGKEGRRGGKERGS